jgi:hypothetical protein
MSGGGGGSGCEAAGHGDLWAVLWSVLFMFVTWAAGQAIGKLGLPPLVRARPRRGKLRWPSGARDTGRVSYARLLCAPCPPPRCPLTCPLAWLRAACGCARDAPRLSDA